MEVNVFRNHNLMCLRLLLELATNRLANFLFVLWSTCSNKRAIECWIRISWRFVENVALPVTFVKNVWTILKLNRHTSWFLLYVLLVIEAIDFTVQKNVARNITNCMNYFGLNRKRNQTKTIKLVNHSFILAGSVENNRKNVHRIW